MAEAFFVPERDRFLPQPWTRGPWSAEAQHAGPAAALFGRAIEALEPVGELRVARFTMDVLRPIPLTPLSIEARVVRPGRRVQLAEAVLRDDEGEVCRAAAWRIRTSEEPIPERNLDAPSMPGPEESPVMPMWDPGWGESYFSAMEWRFGAGAFFEPGPAAAWMRMRVPLVEGEDPSPLSRVLVCADSGNGISMELPLGDHLFINTELTVHLVRLPVGEWVCLDAITRLAPDGIGVAESILWDERGRIGGGAQALLVGKR